MKNDHAALTALLVSIIGISGLSACVQKMAEHGHLRPLGGDPALLAVSGIPPEGTIAQSGSGRTSAAQASRPALITRSLLNQGREQYAVSCLPCHGPSGHGDGMIVQRGFLAPPSYHTDRLRQASDEHFFEVITHGYGAMYGYADRVTESDRWAIIAYIRALQLSQHARWVELGPADRSHLSLGGAR